MYSILQEGEYDCVDPADRPEGEAKIKSFLSDQFYKVNRVSQTNIVPGARDFRMMTRQMVDAILSMKNTAVFQGIFSWVGLKPSI